MIGARFGGRRASRANSLSQHMTDALPKRVPTRPVDFIECIRRPLYVQGC